MIAILNFSMAFSRPERGPNPLFANIWLKAIVEQKLSRIVTFRIARNNEMYVYLLFWLTMHVDRNHHY
jgi:hypothetical protein